MKSTREIIILIGILALSFSLRLTFVNDPFERDEGAYGYIAQEILRGAIPYRDAIDHKPPGVHYIYALLITLAGDQTWSIRLLTAFYALLSVVSVYWLTRYIYGPAAGLFAGFLYGIFSSGPTIRGSSSNCEVFMVFPIVLAVYLFIRRVDSGKRLYLWGSGLMLALAILIKTTALPYLALIILFLFLMRRDKSGLKPVLEDAVALLVPSAVIAVLTVAYFVWQGAFDDFLYWNVTFNRIYGKTTLAEFLYILSVRVPQMSSEHLVLWILAVPTAIRLLLEDRNIKNLLLAALIPVSFVAVSMPGKFSWYYFILMIPPLSINAGIGLAKLLEHKGWPLYLAIPVILAAFTYSIKLDYNYYLRYTPDEVSEKIYKTEAFVNAAEIAKYIKERTLSSDYIFQWGWEPEIYFLSGRRAPNRFISVGFIEAVRDPKKAAVEMEESIKLKRPKFIVLQKSWENVSGYHELGYILQKDYRLEFQRKDYWVFRLKEAF